MWADFPSRFMPIDVTRRWFFHLFAGDVRAAGWAFTEGSQSEQLAFKWDMPLRDLVDYEIGKARKAVADFDAIRRDLVEYQARTGAGFNVDRTMVYIKRAAGL